MLTPRLSVVLEATLYQILLSKKDIFGHFENCFGSKGRFRPQQTLIWLKGDILDPLKNYFDSKETFSATSKIILIQTGPFRPL